MQNNDLYLLANPNHIKKKKIKYSIDDSLFSLLQRKFPQCKITKDDYKINIGKIEKLFIETSNSNIIEGYLNEIIQSVINEQVLS